jgi:alkylation response protein AidB-like acyl-CoA dehydrogenase
MQFGFTEEQDDLRVAVRSFLEDRSPESEVRRLMETERGFEPSVWAEMAGMGLLGLAIPEALGGAGCGPVEVGVVLEETGAVLLCAPYFSTVVLATSVLLHAGDEAAAAEFLPGIATGALTAAFALTEPSGRWDADGVTLTAQRSGAGWALDGVKTYVLDGHTAGLVLVAARSAAGVSLFAVDGDAPGLSRTPLPTLDLTRKQARLDFAGVPARLIGADGAGWPVISRVLDLAAVGLAAEQVGGAQRVLDMAVAYAKVRHQFGRPIGSFQAIKHKCADVLLEVESARSASQYALWAAATLSEELPVVASLTKAYCSEAFSHATAENIQVHGGIGFTWEHPAHLYFKRARSSQVLLGDPTYHRELLAQRIGL